MKRVFLALLLIVASAWAQEAVKATPPNPAAPPAAQATPAVSPENASKAFVAEDSFDAGNVIKGKKVEHAFVIKNMGKSDLEILSAKPG
jgi:hypothetical protein